jgi:hypothetical protein
LLLYTLQGEVAGEGAAAAESALYLQLGTMAL